RSAYSIEVPGEVPATLLSMPAWRAGEYLGVKLVTVFPGNSMRNQRSVAAIYTLFSARDGRVLAVLDGEEITARRTAAASALAARYLARDDASHLVMIGAGRQARGLVAAHAGVRPIKRVTVWSRRLHHAEAAAAEISNAMRSLEVRASDDLEHAVRDADIVSCATLATVPVLRGAWLRAGTHVDLVGAFRAYMREADDDVMCRADTLVVDERTAALAEGGDIVQAIASGAIDASRIDADLRELVGGGHRGRLTRDQITVFKSVGFALEDLAAAVTTYEAVCARGRPAQTP
ncbi:MAG: ornithine cyclodeaminase family protein, partial [Casimicrobiaceae bacterium]